MFPSAYMINSSRYQNRQRGFSLLAGVFLLVIFASLSVFLVSLSTMQQVGSTVDLQGTRAYQAARYGIETGAFQTLSPVAAPACPGATSTFPGTSLQDFTTTVTCSLTTANELGTTVNIYQITATACNQPPCPNATPSQNYVERQLTITVSR
jgi:MSHA biogenesis protein MshP